MIWTIVTYIIYLLLSIGVFFTLLAGIGLLRFPDVYTRLHAGTKCTTFGSIFLIISVVILGLKTWYLGDNNGSILAIHSFIVLIAILYAPENSCIVYGQPKEGAVLVKVTSKKREEITNILEKMKRFRNTKIIGVM